MEIGSLITTIRNSTSEEPEWLTNAIKSRIRNASQVPKIYYGLHFCEGVAEYRESGQKPYRVLINEATAKRMDATFPGRPVVVLHTEEELEEMLPTIMEKADGFVVESFFNEADGKHWAKFLAITDRAHEAISKGWALSNCYKIKNKGQGGSKNGVDYNNEVLDGAYEHLAIVPNPRYESKILTPEAFKAYNSDKKLELERLANSTNEGDKSMKFNFFRKQKVEKLENASDVESLTVILPKSKAEVTVAEAIEIADTVKNMQGYCNMDHMVKVGDEEMTVNDLVKRHVANEEEKKKALAAAEGDGADKAENEDGEEEAEEDADLQNDDGEEEESETPAQKKERLANEKKEKDIAAKAKKERGREHFSKLSNAADIAALRAEEEETVLDTERAQIARGQERYGSKK